MSPLSSPRSALCTLFLSLLLVAPSALAGPLFEVDTNAGISGSDDELADLIADLLAQEGQFAGLDGAATYEGTTMYDGGLELAVPISSIFRGGDVPTRWTVTPFGHFGVGYRGDLARGYRSDHVDLALALRFR